MLAIEIESHYHLEMDVPPSAPEPKPAKPSGKASALPRVRTLTTDALFNGADEVRISHHGAEYRLKVTRQGKLILTK